MPLVEAVLPYGNCTFSSTPTIKTVTTDRTTSRHYRPSLLRLAVPPLQLQAQFNADVFLATEREYEAEGISLDRSTYTDNAACLALLEGRVSSSPCNALH